MLTLLSLKGGEEALVREIHGGHLLRRRLSALGLHPGDTVRLLRFGVLGGPVLVEVHGAAVAIGRDQAASVEVELEAAHHRTQSPILRPQ